MKTAQALVFVLGMGVLSGCAGKTFRLEAGGGVQGLSRLTSDKSNEINPAISPDGRILLFDVRRKDEVAINGMDPSTGGRRTVFTSSSSSAGEPSWSPAADHFVFTSNSTGVWSLVRSLTSSPNAAVAVIVSGEMAPAVSDPSVSPDGQRVAFSTYMRGSWNVGMANIDGSSFTLFGEGFAPVWSPDGNRLAFVRVVDKRAQIFSVDAENGTNLIQLTSGEMDNIDPAWSPDGSLLVFSSNRTARKANGGIRTKEKREVYGNFNLFVLKPDGTGLIQLTDGNGINYGPCWGGDGWIYFASNQAGNYDIWRLRPSGITGG